MTRRRVIVAWLVDILGGAAFGLGVIDLVLLLFPKWHPSDGLHVLLTVILAAAYVGVSRWLNRQPSKADRQPVEVDRQPSDVRSFQKTDPLFVSFYQNWYRQPGRLYVYCDETDWLEGDARSPILQSLFAKGDRAVLCVRHPEGKLIPDLREHGVEVVDVSREKSYASRLSLLVDDGQKELIIRELPEGGESMEVNTFRQTRDPYLVALAEDFFRSAGIDL